MQRPSWLKKAGVTDIFSVSPCLSKDFADYVSHWKQNGHWLFNKPSDMDEIATREGVDRSALRLFYYEIYEEEFDEGEKRWSSFLPEPSLATNVEKPARAHLEGFDVVTSSTGEAPECSPLSCNSLADEVEVTEHCLFASFDEAKGALEGGRFDNSEPGPFRIFAVYSVTI